MWVGRASFVRSRQQPTRTGREKSSLSDLRQLSEWDLMFEWFFGDKDETDIKSAPAKRIVVSNKVREV